jgi:hypothetical protein
MAVRRLEEAEVQLDEARGREASLKQQLKDMEAQHRLVAEGMQGQLQQLTQALQTTEGALGRERGEWEQALATLRGETDGAIAQKASRLQPQRDQKQAS